MLGTASTVVSKVLALLGQGGPFMFILLGLSIVALTIILAKFWQFRSRRVGRHRFIGPILQTWHSRDRAAAIDMIARERGPVARVMHAAMHGATRMQIDRGTLGDEVQRIAREQLAAIDSGMRGLELIAFLAPLFGFFGTILALMGIGLGGESGFEAALISSAGGLAISILITVFYYLFDRRIEGERATMESALSQILSAPARPASSRREPARRAAEEPEYEEEEYEDYEEYEEDEGYYEPEFR